MQNRYAYRIKGGRPVTGKIRCFGAKNFVTKAMIAALLGDTPTTLTNVPAVGDTDITREMLASIGVSIEYIDNETMIINPATMSSATVPLPHSGSNRMPILLLGVLLHRYAEVFVPVLGGCQIGARSVDFHLDAIQQFGGMVEEASDGFVARRNQRLQGTHIELPYPSVGATETCLYLSVLAEGRTVISNAAIEPEIMELITMLRFMGAIIFTSPGREIRVDGVRQLQGTRMKILGDRIEAASWASLACASGGNITVEGIRPEILGNFLSYFREVGGGFEQVNADTIRFYRENNVRPAIIETNVYPGFSTDWQQPFAVLLTQAEGISIIHETVYEKRFGYLTALNKLGARTQLATHCLGTPCRYHDKGYEHSAIIIGPSQLEGGLVSIPDLRAGLAYVIATAIAEGTSIVEGTHFIERGYGDIVPRLAALNLQIEKIVL